MFCVRCCVVRGEQKREEIFHFTHKHTGDCYIFESFTFSDKFSVVAAAVSSDCWFSSSISRFASSFSKYVCHLARRSFWSASDSSILAEKRKQFINCAISGRSSISIYLYLVFPSHVSAVSLRWPKKRPFMSWMTRSASSGSAIVIWAMPSGWRCWGNSEMNDIWRH